ncbi:MAG TPA: copper amine oxidase N-terminal domain-containing protein [Symbiobacteriaceae bacterium]|jgi:hypothetical protein
MAKSMRKVLAVLGTLVLLVALAGTMAGTSSAANLTGGNTTYVINGEETTFSYDPVVRKDGLLLPVEVFQRLGITVDGTLGKNVTLTKGTDVTAIVTVGTTTASLNTKPYLVATAPLRLNGRVFLPADILKEFGVDVAQDGNMVVIRNYAEGVDSAKNLSDADYAALKNTRWFTTAAKADTSIYLTTDFTILTPALLNAANLGLSYGMRARMLTLLQTNTLIYVRVQNLATKTGSLVTSGLYLVDSQGNQYDTPTVLDIGNGLVSGKLAPNSARAGILSFPKIQSTAAALSLFYDNNNSNLGVFGVTN